MSALVEGQRRDDLRPASVEFLKHDAQSEKNNADADDRAEKNRNHICLRATLWISWG